MPHGAQSVQICLRAAHAKSGVGPVSSLHHERAQHLWTAWFKMSKVSSQGPDLSIQFTPAQNAQVKHYWELKGEAPEDSQCRGLYNPTACPAWASPHSNRVCRKWRDNDVGVLRVANRGLLEKCSLDVGSFECQQDVPSCMSSLRCAAYLDRLKSPRSKNARPTRRRP